jgi:uncharacterized membrane protein (Fun14 family)
MITSQSLENGGVIESIKSSLQPESIANRFGIDKSLLIDIGLYGAIGLLIGFFIKKYSEYCIAFILLIIGLIILQQFDYIMLTVNSEKIHTMLGLQGIPLMGESSSSLLFDWMRSHVISSSSFVVGLLIGLKVA